MTLETYLVSYLGDNLAQQLEWTTSASSFDFVMSEALRLYGVDTEAEATDLDKLYALSKVTLWEAVLREVSMDYDYSANGASFKRSQMVDQIKENLDSAITESMNYSDSYNSIQLGTLGGDEVDPYSEYPYEDR